jgi:hypothetical protein
MNFHLMKSRIYKLLLTITTSIVFVFIINQAQAIDEATRLKALESAVCYDKKTGLEWLAGPDKPTNWYDAKRWVESLTAVAGGGWQMPTLKELKTLYQKGEKCHIKPFLKTTGCLVWSGETKDSSSAWCYNYFYDPGSSILSGGDGSGSYKVFLNRDDSTDFTRGFAVRSRK